MGAKLDADVAGAGAVDTSKFSGEEHEQLFQADLEDWDTEEFRDNTKEVEACMM